MLAEVVKNMAEVATKPWQPKGWTEVATYDAAIQAEMAEISKNIRVNEYGDWDPGGGDFSKLPPGTIYTGPRGIGVRVQLMKGWRSKRAKWPTKRVEHLATPLLMQLIAERKILVREQK